MSAQLGAQLGAPISVAASCGGQEGEGIMMGFRPLPEEDGAITWAEALPLGVVDSTTTAPASSSEGASPGAWLPQPLMTSPAPQPQPASSWGPSLKRPRPGAIGGRLEPTHDPPGGQEADPVALELGGQVERLLQARLLRAANRRCHGLDDGTQGLPLLHAKDRALL